MELVKNIFFNTDKIIENEKVKISYIGNLYQNNSDQVFLHYGYGLQWDDLSDVEMQKTELGYQCEIDVHEFDSLNLCFRNSNNEWDNNDGQNYIFPIEKAPEEDQEYALVEVKNLGMQPHKGLRKTYIWSKKVRLAVYKIIRYFPKIISGNYKRKVNDEQ